MVGGGSGGEGCGTDLASRVLGLSADERLGTGQGRSPQGHCLLLCGGSLGPRAADAPWSPCQCPG